MYENTKFFMAQMKTDLQHVCVSLLCTLFESKHEHYVVLLLV